MLWQVLTVEEQQRVLVEAHVDPTDGEKVSLCTLAVKHSRPDILKKLLNKTAQSDGLRSAMVLTPTSAPERGNWHGTVAMHQAVQCGDAASVRLLLQHSGELQVVCKGASGMIALI